EELCDRVAIIDGGRLVDMDTPMALASRGDSVVVMSFTTNGADVGFVSEIPGVRAVRQHNGSAVVTGAPLSVVDVAVALRSAGIVPPDFRTRYPSLEDVFLTLTGRSLRN